MPRRESPTGFPGKARRGAHLRTGPMFPWVLRNPQLCPARPAQGNFSPRGIRRREVPLRGPCRARLRAFSFSPLSLSLSLSFSPLSFLCSVRVRIRVRIRLSFALSICSLPLSLNARERLAREQKVDMMSARRGICMSVVCILRVRSTYRDAKGTVLAHDHRHDV